MHKIFFNDLKTFSLDIYETLNKKSCDVIASGWWLNGNETELFSKNFSSYIGVKHCIPVANGTDALEIAMRSICKIRGPKFNEVITVGNAGGYSTIACHLVGLKPIYADIDQSSLLIDIDSALSCLGERTSFIVVTHLYGNVVNVKGLRNKLDQLGYKEVLILEDCAQAHGAMLDSEKVGSLADIATFSFYPTKNLGALGDAGAVVTNRDDLSEIVRSLSQYGWSGKYDIKREYGRNSRMDEIQAGFLNILLPYLDKWNQQRIEIFNLYKKKLVKECTLANSSFGNVVHLCVVQTTNRDELNKTLLENGIHAAIHYPIADFNQDGWRNMPYRLTPTGINNTEIACSKVLSLPCYPRLSHDDVDRVIKVINEYYD